MADNYKPGDHWVIDDQTGQKVRASETQRQWNGLVVDRRNFETRHPQELIRARREQLQVKDPRPRPIDLIIGPLTTTVATAAAAGDSTIVLETSVRMEAGDTLKIMLDNGDSVLRIIGSIPDATSVTLIQALPWAVSVGNAVIDITAMAAADLP